jgi:Uma2 family endonuclease
LPVQISISQIRLLAGQRISLADIDWRSFEKILAELGEHRSARIAYHQGVLDLRMPLPEHERIKVLIGDLLKIILDELNLEWESLGSSTFKNQNMKAGIEPDDCFYIQNYAAILGKNRLDLSIDPVPDLAIEVDLTSSTQLNAYEALGVSEIWRYKDGRLAINLFQAGKYIQSATSRALPTVPAIELISLFLARSIDLPMSTVRREFRLYLRANIFTN